MNTLKPTILTLLIPLGWTISADAFPRFLEVSSNTLELAPQSTCHAEVPGQLVAEALGETV